jgi:hypothetical protein
MLRSQLRYLSAMVSTSLEVSHVDDPGDAAAYIEVLIARSHDKNVSPLCIASKASVQPIKSITNKTTVMLWCLVPRYFDPFVRRFRVIPAQAVNVRYPHIPAHVHRNLNTCRARSSQIHDHFLVRRVRVIDILCAGGDFVQHR